MADAPVRPLFSNGAVLAADDLALVTDHARAQLARHERAEHIAGIGEGLHLRSTKAADSSILVTLESGVAVTGEGRPLVVPADVPLSEQDLVDLGIQAGSAFADPAHNDRSLPCPVFLLADERSELGSPFGSRCGPGAPTRIREGVAVEFGLPGEELALADQPRSGAGDDPADDAPPWRILLGYVVLRLQDQKFIAVLDRYRQVGRTNAGVRADTVVARSASLLLRTGDLDAGPGKPAVLVDESGGGRLVFGLTDPSGGVTPVLSVDAKGVVDTIGTVKAAAVQGTTWVESGTVSDGLIIPLPTGADPKLVAGGQARVHVHVRARASDPTRLVGAERVTVDDTRRVRVSVWGWTAPTPTGAMDQLAAVADYLIIVAVPPGDGGTP